MTTGERMRKIRKEKGLTQKEVAEKLGVTVGAYSHYETGKREIDAPTIKALSAILGVSGDELIDTGFQYSQNNNMLRVSDLHTKKVPLVGSVAAGEPINDAEFPDAFVLSPMDCDYAIKVHGQSMEPTYLDDDIVYVRSASVLPYDGAVVVLRIGNGETAEHCIKHVIQTDAGIVIMSDNPEYPAKFISSDQCPTIIGIPVGFTRMYKKTSPR